MKVSVIIPAAGLSSRMSYRDKLTVKINNIPVIVRTLSVFHDMDQINEIILAVSLEKLDYYNELLREYDFNGKVKAVQGGESRKDTVANGFRHVSKDTDMVMVHDGARPFVTRKIIETCIEKCLEHDCCCAGVKSKDTVKVSDESGFVSYTPSRNNVYLIHTPQCFRYEIAKEIYLNENTFEVTDDSEIAEALGYKVFIAESEYTNIKITTDSDIEFAKWLSEYKNT